MKADLILFVRFVRSARCARAFGRAEWILILAYPARRGGLGSDLPSRGAGLGRGFVGASVGVPHVESQKTQVSANEGREPGAPGGIANDAMPPLRMTTHQQVPPSR